MKVTVIGGGWAGLAAAVSLSQHGCSVTVIEASRQLGGRARAIQFGDNQVDNGQHIMLGAYCRLLEYLDLIGVEENKVLRRLPLDLKFGNRNSTRFHLRAPKLPAPAHLLFGLLGAKGLKLFDRFAVLKVVISMRLSSFKLPEDIPLKTYLEQHGQTKNNMLFLWQPLCISVLNTPIETASTELFLNVIRDAFFGKNSDSDMLLPIGHLNACFPDPAMEYIEAKDGAISLGERVESITIENDAIKSINTKKGVSEVSNIVIATSPEHAHTILKDHKQLDDITNVLGSLKSLPITTLYLRYPEPVSLDRDFTGFLNCHTQWLFDRDRLTGDACVLAAVISGPGEHMNMSVDELTKAITREISEQYPDFPEPVETKLVREKMATLDSSVGINNKRIQNKTPVKGLWIAGDYTNTGYPSTLEGAVRSGFSCAQAIINENK